ncbi:Multiple sugar-binding protein [Cellulomonas hominis]|nr:Multiple sugar-binding protein [Cellulomonas hominis]
MRGRRRVVVAVALLAAGAALAVGCTAQPAPRGHVDVLGLWSGPELDGFRTVAAVWEHDTGGVVDWDGSQDVARDLATRLSAGDPPDVAVLPNPGLLRALARDGALVPLDRVLDPERVARDYAPAWLDLGSHDGVLYGVFSRAANKGTVWYSPRDFAAAGYTVPATWDELMALADRMVADGRTPFSVVAPRGPGSGWALTDWVASLVLTTCGPQVYDGWVAAEIPWTDPCVRESFTRLGTVLATPGYVLGGARAVLTTGDAEGVLPVYADPPEAAMYPLASFAQGFLTQAYPDLSAGTDYDAFPFPPVDPACAGSVTVGGDVVVLLRDTPAARSFLAFLTGAAAQEAWVRLGGHTSVNRSVPPGAYPDGVARAVADDLTGAEVVRFGAGDLMPAAVQRAWWDVMLRLVEDPAGVDEVLASLTEVAAAAR